MLKCKTLGWWFVYYLLHYFGLEKVLVVNVDVFVDVLIDDDCVNLTIPACFSVFVA